MKKFLLGLFLSVTCLLVTPSLSNAASGNSLPKQTELKVTEKKVNEKKVVVVNQDGTSTDATNVSDALKKAEYCDVIIIETSDVIIIIIIC